MTDGKVAQAVNRIYGYLVRLDNLPNGSYSAAIATTKAEELRVKINAVINLIRQSTHANADLIASIIQVEIAAGRAASISKNVRFHFSFPKNWNVEKHQLKIIADKTPDAKKVGRPKKTSGDAV